MIDVQTFKRLFQVQVSTVTVITTQCGEKKAGLTATAVCSLQDDPPSLVISVNRKSNAYRVILEARKFAVNLLNDEQQAVAGRFAKHAANNEEAYKKFEEAGSWISSRNQLPILEDAVATAECEVAQVIELNTHAILIGHIIDVHQNDEATPLLYGYQKYANLRDQIQMNHA